MIDQVKVIAQNGVCILLCVTCGFHPQFTESLKHYPKMANKLMLRDPRQGLVGCQIMLLC